ncbi:MAG: LysM peptidoglycan-binding domain-containing protein [Desulfobacteraceae bacterium]|nr:LysM peptidoglycan-binding domain-containing protein [Desulfobacteraceae bacterium]
MKLRIIYLAPVLLLLLNGCVQTLHKTSSLDNNIISHNNSESDVSKPVVKKDNSPVSDMRSPEKNKADVSGTPENDNAFVENNTPTSSDRNIPEKSDISKPEPVKETRTELSSEDDYSCSIDTTASAVIIEDTESYDNTLTQKDIQNVLDNALSFCESSQDFWQKGELEKALDALDNAYSLILDVDTEGNPALTQQKEELRFMISKRILEIHASRNTIVKGKHNAIPIVMNKHVLAEISILSKGREEGFFVQAYKRSGMYRERIVEELKKAGLPVELSWLPLIESGFTVNAFSRARALGLWQFIPSTGYKFGLKRDKYIDERLDPEKSTKAAIAYLKELHNIFGDWSTVLAAYNCGEGRVLRVIRNQNVNYLDNFWDLYKRLPRETARYVPRFLATLHIIKNPKKYGLDKIALCSPLEYETVTISKRARLKDVARLIGVPQKLMVQLNSELRHKIIPGNKYTLKVPPNKKSILISKIDKIPAPSLPTATTRTIVRYKIKRGDTLSTIARRYKTSVKSITKANRLTKKSRIIAGKILKIPQKRKLTFSSKKYKKTKRRQVSKKYVVKNGDSLWTIARRYGTTTKQIRKLNNLRSSKLKKGQVLKIPGKSKKAKSDSRIYLVKRGDVPQKIAKRYNMSLKRFLNMNRLKNGSKIYPGQKLYVE